MYNYSFCFKPNTKKVIEDLQKVERNIESANEEALRQFANYMIRMIDETFYLEGDRGGMERWRKSATSLRTGRRTLEGTGRLQNSIRIQSIDKDGFTIGSNLEYAAEHQHGTKGQWERPFLFFALDGSDLKQAIDNIRNALKGGL